MTRRNCKLISKLAIEEEEREDIDELYKLYEKEALEEKAWSINIYLLFVNVNTDIQKIVPPAQQQVADPIEEILRQSAQYN